MHHNIQATVITCDAFGYTAPILPPTAKTVLKCRSAYVEVTIKGRYDKACQDAAFHHCAFTTTDTPDSMLQVQNPSF
jgi:hypothetical protein